MSKIWRVEARPSDDVVTFNVVAETREEAEQLANIECAEVARMNVSWCIDTLVLVRP